MATINSNHRRFDNGGVIELADGGTKTVDNVMDGSFSWKPAAREVQVIKDRGVYKQAMDGDDTLAEIDFDFGCGELTSAASSLYATLMQAGSAGLVKEFTSLVIKIPDYRGASTGESLTFTNVYCDRDSLRWSKGGKMGGVNSISGKLYARSGPTPATY